MRETDPFLTFHSIDDDYSAFFQPDEGNCKYHHSFEQWSRYYSFYTNKRIRLTSGQVQRRDPSLDLDLRMRRLGSRVPEPYLLVEMTTHDGRTGGFRRYQVITTGSGKLGLNAYAYNITIH